MKCLICKTNTSSITTTELRRGKGSVYFCEACDLGMLQLQEKQEKRGREYYSKEYRKYYVSKIGHETNAEEMFNISSPYQKDRVDLIKDKLHPDMKLLDIGCSAGQFLYAVKPYVSEIVGIDYDEKATKHASSVCDCKTYSTDIQDTDINEGYFDIICMFQALEHVEEPLNLLLTVKKYLKPDGLFYIEVPSLYDPLISLYENKAYWRFFFHDAHLFYFSPKSLAKLLDLVGFKGDVHFVQDYNFLNHMNWIYANTPQDDSEEGLSDPRLPLSSKLDKNKHAKLSSWIKKVDREYKAILKEIGLTENISFIGSSKKE